MRNSITFKNYKDCLFNKEHQMKQMNVIRSHDHNVYTETVNKMKLSNEDDKRIIREDDVHTYAYGHFRRKSGGNSVSSGPT